MRLTMQMGFHAKSSTLKLWKVKAAPHAAENRCVGEENAVL